MVHVRRCVARIKCNVLVQAEAFKDGIGAFSLELGLISTEGTASKDVLSAPGISASRSEGRIILLRTLGSDSIHGRTLAIAPAEV
jgi:hypothetical protein